jgi:hypothetical protein
MENSKLNITNKKAVYLTNLKKSGIPGPKKENYDELGLQFF